MIRAPRTLMLVVAIAGLIPLAGCFGSDEPDAVVVEEKPTIKLTESVVALAQSKPLDFTFPLQKALPVARTYFNGTIGAESAASVESQGDRGGTSYNTVIVEYDVANLIPAGQPALVDIQLTWNNRPGEAADLDIVVDLPGTRTHESRAYYDEWSWTLPVEIRNVATVGVAGAPHMVGVQAANGRILPVGGLAYSLQVSVHYAKNVLTPGVPYAVTVPANASGLVFESVKFAGDTHVAAEFIVVSPENTMVSHHEFNDLAVPTESLYVPVPGPGEYVIYIPHMSHGFLRVSADAPPDVREARVLKMAWESLVLLSDAAAPGVAEHEVYDQSTAYTEGTSVAFNLDTAFPLEVRPFIQGANVATGDVDLRVSSPAGQVARYHRALRYDDDRGRIGFTDETDARENAFHPENLMRGAYVLSAAVNGQNGEIGVRVLTFQR